MKWRIPFNDMLFIYHLFSLPQVGFDSLLVDDTFYEANAQPTKPSGKDSEVKYNFFGLKKTLTCTRFSP